MLNVYLSVLSLGLSYGLRPNAGQISLNKSLMF